MSLQESIESPSSNAGKRRTPQRGPCEIGERKGDRSMAAPESLRSKIEAYFEANQEEEMKRSDLAAKFGVHPNTVDKALRELLPKGELESVNVIRRKSKVAQ